MDLMTHPWILSWKLNSGGTYSRRFAQNEGRLQYFPDMLVTSCIFVQSIFLCDDLIRVFMCILSDQVSVTGKMKISGFRQTLYCLQYIIKILIYLYRYTIELLLTESSVHTRNICSDVHGPWT